SGRWRRNPDGRWALTPEQVAEINCTQLEILSRRANQVRPGGKLVYGTCSVFAVENHLTIQSFLAEHADFKLEPFVSPITGKQTDGMLQTFSGDGDCDGSFVAVLRRKK
ncbi:MAG: RsmB/NOP family class I SAM-dependent RNA methyltransferase, partial [Lentisphaeria bacterium]|nr:RsmB/NOP family class I SAM-dependent RNA methyltransferase [Lentisphaeria bacterium]